MQHKIMSTRVTPLLLGVLFISIIVRLIFFFTYHEIGWDEAVYLGMGRYLFSSGTQGLWEHIRPIGLPVLFGIFWNFGIHQILAAKIFELLMSIGVIFTLYVVTKNFFDEKTALLTIAFFSFSAIFFTLGFHTLTEIPSLFFVLMAILFTQQQRWYLAGLFSSAAFIMRFPMGLFLVPLAVQCFFTAKKFRRACSKLLCGIVTLVMLLLFFNHYSTGTFFGAFGDAQQVINNVLGCNVLHYLPWWTYFSQTLHENFLHIFAIVGIILLIHTKKFLPLAYLIVPLLYYLPLHCRDYRYLVSFLPFLTMFTAYGINKTIIFSQQKIQRLPAYFFSLVLFIIFTTSLFTALHFYYHSEASAPYTPQQNYFTFLHNITIAGEVWSSNPSVALYTAAPIQKVYYPVYTAQLAEQFYHHLQSNTPRVTYVFLDNCGGGMICPPQDILCEENTQKIRHFLAAQFTLVYDKTENNCYYQIYKK